MKTQNNHLVYMAVITVLAAVSIWQYRRLSAQNELFALSRTTLATVTDITESGSIGQYTEIHIHVQEYQTPTNEAWMRTAANIRERAEKIRTILNSQSEKLTSGEQSALTAEFISTVRDSILALEAFGLQSWDTSDINQNNQLTNLPNRSPEFWQTLEANRAAQPEQVCHILRGALATLERVLVNKITEETNHYVSNCDFPKVAIFPSAGSVVVGETFEAEVAFTQYDPQLNDLTRVTVNNETVAIKEGVATYRKTETSPGLKTVKAMMALKNPYTGQVTQHIGEYQYRVLPKCSVNCTDEPD